MTALSVYYAFAASTTISTANKLYASGGGSPTTAQNLTTINGSTGYGEIPAQGSAAAWAAGGSIGTPTGKGFFLDATTLDGQTLASGNYSGIIRFNTQAAGAVTADIYVRVYRYHPGTTTYTQIVSMVLTGQSLTNTITSYSLPSTSGSATAFATGDKLYVDAWLNITTNTSSAGQQVKHNRQSTDTTTFVGDTQAVVVTPGYSAGGTAATKSIPLRTLVRTLATKSLSLRTSVRTATFKSMVLRTIVSTGTVAKKSIVLRTIVQNVAARSLPLRTPIRTATIASVTLRTIVAAPAPPLSPSYTIVDLHFQKTQLVQVFDPSGNFLAVWPDAPHISGLKDTVNCAQGQIKMVLPRPINNYDALGQVPTNGSVAEMNQVKIYVFGPGLPKTGMLKFSGFIDTLEASVTDTQQQGVTVTLTPWSAAFGDHGFGGSQQFNNIDPIQLFKYWFNTTDPLTGVKYTDPLTWDPANPSSSGKTVNYLIQGLDLKSIGDTVITMLGSGWFWRPNPINTVTIGQVPATAQHTFQLGKHFASMSYSVDNTQRKNVVYFTGASNAYGTLHTALTANTSTTIVATGAAFAPFTAPSGTPLYLVIVDPVNGNETVTCTLPATGTGPYTFPIASTYNGGKIRTSHAGSDGLTIQVLIRATAVGTSALPPSQGGIGERLLQVQDSRITDNASAQIVANALLSIYDVPQIRAKFRVVDYRGNASLALGFDIETLKVGDSITILDSRGHTFPSTWGNFTWGQSAWGQSEGAVFNQVIPIASLNYNWNYVDVEAGILAPSQDRQLFQLQRKFSDFTLGV